MIDLRWEWWSIVLALVIVYFIVLIVGRKKSRLINFSERLGGIQVKMQHVDRDYRLIEVVEGNKRALFISNGHIITQVNWGTINEIHVDNPNSKTALVTKSDV